MPKKSFVRISLAALLAIALPFLSPAQDAPDKPKPAPKPSAPAKDSTDRPANRAKPDSIAEIVERSRESVVTITHSGRGGKEEGLGTGFIIDADGLIATNLHVIGEARPIQVEFADGTLHNVTGIHAWDRKRDLAIIRIDQDNLTPLPLGDSDTLKQGAEIIALGNPQGLKYSVVKGIVSALRGFDENETTALIQVAIPVEPGNSGGPILDREGNVQGVVTFKSAVSENLGFAMPVNDIALLLKKPNPMPMIRWISIGALDPAKWRPVMGSRWSQSAGIITATEFGNGFGGRALCLYQPEMPKEPYEISVEVRLDDESGAAGLVFASDGSQVHYGFYPSVGNLRFTRFEGPDPYSWTIIEEAPSERYKLGGWNRLRVRVEKDRILCFVNGEKLMESTDRKLRGGRVGLCKFRATSAEFRAFRIGKNLAAPPVPPEVLRDIERTITDFTATESETPTSENFESLLRDPDTSRTLLQERAELLEKNATRLRELAEQVNRKKIIEELRAALSAPEKDINLFHAGLLIAKLDNPRLELQGYHDELDRMAGEIGESLPEDAADQARLQALNHYLFEENGFHGSRSDYYSSSNSYLNEVLDDHEGIPITLSILYMELAERIDLNRVVGIPLPGHFIVQHRPAKGRKTYIDVFERGKFLNRSEAEDMVFELTGNPATPADFKPSKKRDLILRMLRNLVGIQLNSEDPENALPYLDVYIDLDPDSAGHRLSRSLLRYRKGDHPGTREDLKWLLEHEPEGMNLRRLQDLYDRLE